MLYYGRGVKSCSVSLTPSSFFSKKLHQPVFILNSLSSSKYGQHNWQNFGLEEGGNQDHGIYCRE